jgi:hypothetical protein
MATHLSPKSGPLQNKGWVGAGLLAYAGHVCQAIDFIGEFFNVHLMVYWWIPWVSPWWLQFAPRLLTKLSTGQSGGVCDDESST